MNKLLKGAIHIPEWEGLPWHDHNVHIHCSYYPRLRETTVTLYTKDHKKVLKITDEEHSKIVPESERMNWCLYRKREWQKELRTMYQNMGD